MAGKSDLKTVNFDSFGKDKELRMTSASLVRLTRGWHPRRLVCMKFFDPLAETIKTRNNLPHWQQSGATYFITYRLADSIPRELLDTWRKDREAWLLENPKPWSAETEAEYHKAFSGEMDRMMDMGHGSCVLRERGFQEMMKECFLFFHGGKILRPLMGGDAESCAYPCNHG